MSAKFADSERSVAYRTRLAVAIVSALAIIMVLDISLLRVYDVFSKGILSLEVKEFVFATITFSCVASEILLLIVLQPPRKRMENRRELITRLMFKVTISVLIAQSAIMAYVVLEVFLLRYYDVYAIQLVILASYALGITTIGMLLKRIASWLTLKKGMVLILLFVIGLGNITFNAAVAILDASLRLADRPAQSRPFIGGSTDISKGKFNNIDQLYFYSYVASYVTAWFATAALLYDYSRKLGLVRYYLLVAAPLLFFLFQFSEFFLMVFSPVITFDKFFFNMLNQTIQSFSKPVGGLMLGVQFWIMARLARGDELFRFFLIIAGFGMLFLFSSNQVLLLSITPYPPFGMSAITLMSLSSYMVMIGVYRSSAAITGNSRLRHEIRQVARSEISLVEGIVSGEKRKDIEDKVSRLYKKRTLEIEEETGASPTMTEEEVKQHLEVVLREIKKA